MSGAVSPVTDMPVMPMAPSIPLAPVVPATEGQRAPALVYDTPGEPNDTAAAMANAVTQADPARGAARTAALDTLSPDEQFVRRLAGESTSASATPMVSPGSTIAQGTLVAAVLETSLNSDLPGYVRAVISREVRSFDGRRVLIPRGSHVIGEYKSGLAVGQTRAFVLWTRLLRPDGVSVALGSPATDTAGSNGLLGKVNSHFGKRFGAAMLMSLISAGGQAIGGGGAVIIASPSQAASNAVQRDINIPPTVRVAAGTPIRIFVTRDLDFSGVEGQ
ncbi:TrbI/VirB10 family protein [Novosphingobium sp.]|uniref:TrbI/VirB10 family protein n=1 Tax=Novosphingobium sp. TaxID=1874826 RepID=UPI00260D9F69|nr:TrbI/VirB10 family protein [Novosphingobium sp.]